MKFGQTLRRSFNLLVGTWQESILMALFLIPSIWALLYYSPGIRLFEMAYRNPEGLRALQAVQPLISPFDVLLIGVAWLWIPFAGVIFFRAFDNLERDEPENLELTQIVGLTFGLLLASLGRSFAIMLVSMLSLLPIFCFAFLGPLVALGAILAYVPIIYVWLGLFTADVYVYNGYGFDSFTRSWSGASGNRLPMLGVFMAIYVATVMMSTVAFAGALSFLYAGATGSDGALHIVATVMAAIIFALFASFAACLVRALEFSMYEQFSAPYEAPLQRQPMQHQEPAASPTTPRPASPRRAPITIDTASINVSGLRKVAAATTPREEAIGRITQRFHDSGLNDEEIAAYLEQHWFPTSGGTSWESISDESIQDLETFTELDPEEVSARVRKRLAQLD